MDEATPTPPKAVKDILRASLADLNLRKQGVIFCFRGVPGVESRSRWYIGRPPSWASAAEIYRILAQSLRQSADMIDKLAEEAEEKSAAKN